MNPLPFPTDRSRAVARPAGRLAGAVLVLLGCAKQESAPPAKAAVQPAVVRVVEVREQEWPSTVRVQGTLAADSETLSAAKIAGRIRRVLVDIGTEVRRGQLLAELETQDLELQVRLAEAQLAQARAALGLSPSEKDESLDRLNAPPVRLERSLVEEAQAAFNRAEIAYARQALSTEELEQRRALLRVAQARYSSALNGVDEKISLIHVRRAELAVAKQTLDDAILIAPYDGIVQARHVHEGSYVRVGDPIARIVRTDPLRYRTNVPERLAKRMRIGRKVVLKIEGMEETVSAEISRISPMLDLASRSLALEVDVPNPHGKLRSGWFAEGEIVVKDDAVALTIPPESVREFAGVEKVLLVRDGEATERKIVTGRRRTGQIEVVDGLKLGDAIVDDARNVNAGKVRIASVTGSAGESSREERPLGAAGGADGHPREAAAER